SKQMAINLAPQFIARSGSNIAVAELRADGTTTIGMLNASLSGIGPSVNVPGLATAGFALFNNTAAVWTFRGLTLIDLPSGTTTLLPQSNAVAASPLALYAPKLLGLTYSHVLVWGTATKASTSQYH